MTWCNIIWYGMRIWNNLSGSDLRRFDMIFHIDKSRDEEAQWHIWRQWWLWWWLWWRPVWWKWVIPLCFFVSFSYSSFFDFSCNLLLSLISYFLFLISFFSNSRYYLTFFPLHSSPISYVFILFVFKFLILIVDKKYQNLSSCILLVNSFINFMIVNYIINYH